MIESGLKFTAIWGEWLVTIAWPEVYRLNRPPIFFCLVRK